MLHKLTITLSVILGILLAVIAIILGLFSLITWQIVGVLVAVSIGIPTSDYSV